MPIRKLSDDEKQQQELEFKLRQDLARFEEMFSDSSEVSDESHPEAHPDLYHREDIAPPPPMEKTRRNPDGLVDVVTFCTHDYFLGLQPTPAQALILKVFYMGTPGNHHLQINEDRTDTCDKCIWKYNRDSEVRYSASKIKSAKGTGRIELPVMDVNKPENSVCFQCTRFDRELTEERLQDLVENEFNATVQQKYRDLLDRELFDLFETEMEFLCRKEISEDVRTQILEKRGNKFQELILVLGRRSGKSFMVSIICLYEVYKLLMMGHPQARYPVMPQDSIGLLNVALSESQAKGAIFDKIRSLVFGSPYLVQYVGKETQLELHFLTPYDVSQNRRNAEQNKPLSTGTIQLRSGHSNASTLVGGTLWMIIMDEMAEMAGDKDDGNDGDLYSKLLPSVATFGMDGKMVCISNPLAPVGKFHKLYKESFDDPNTLMFQLPTWLANPNIDREFLRKQLKKDASNYGMHYGAQFGASGTSPFLPGDYVDLAFERGIGRHRSEHGIPLMRYFMHLDPAYSSDNYTLCICHNEPMQGNKLGPDSKPLLRVVIDHIKIWEPKGPNHPVNVEEVDSYVLDLARRFKFVQISYDHWNSQGSITKLKGYGLNVVQRTFTGQYQDEIFQELYDLFISERVDFYNEDTREMKDGRQLNLKDATMSKHQLKLLQKIFRGKRFKVEAVKGEFDDVPDAVAAAAYECLKDKVYNPTPKTRVMRLGGHFR